jgi:hypothetical protein
MINRGEFVPGSHDTGIGDGYAGTGGTIFISGRIYFPVSQSDPIMDSKLAKSIQAKGGSFRFMQSKTNNSRLELEDDITYIYHLGVGGRVYINLPQSLQDETKMTLAQAKNFAEEYIDVKSVKNHTYLDGQFANAGSIQINFEDETLLYFQNDDIVPSKEAHRKKVVDVIVTLFHYSRLGPVPNSQKDN